MMRTARLWKGAGPWALGGLLALAGLAARADDLEKAPPLAKQLTQLARQAFGQGHIDDSLNFYRQVLKLDPKNAEAKRALAAKRVVRVKRQDPAQPPAAEPPPGPGAADDQAKPPAAEPPPVPAAAEDRPAPPPRATLGAAAELSRVEQERVLADVRDQIRRSRELVRAGMPQDALESLRMARNLLNASGDQVDEATRTTLTRDIQAAYQTTLRDEERFEQERAEVLRRQGMALQQEATLADLNTNEVKSNALMETFNTLMAEGTFNVLYNGGIGDIDAQVAPFFDAYTVAKQARALEPRALAPRLGMQTAQAEGFLAQTLSYEELKEIRFLMTLEDTDRASVPFPDTQVLEYPPVERFRAISERRIKRYETSYLGNTDPKTQQILDKLNQPVTIPFENETPLSEVVKYVKNATSSGPGDPGIPIWVDPNGLQEQDKTLESTVTLNLEGVPLKTTLRLMLKQLDLDYVVKDGLLRIVSKADDDPNNLETRIYPVADLALIPFSLMMGGGGGMMGGG
ncbi:MAG TPA: tetratricopeptide repeat protein, partial [Isosphaeraceae bacterium]|nr:tetratricopeptide repeat protein [Isosphaeraceae bacterium]